MNFFPNTRLFRRRNDPKYDNGVTGKTMDTELTKLVKAVPEPVTRQASDSDSQELASLQYASV